MMTHIFFASHDTRLFKSTRPLLPFFLYLTASAQLFATTLKFSPERTAFYRDESPTLNVMVDGDLPEQGILEIKLGDRQIHRGTALPGKNAIPVPAHLFRSGNHELTARLLDAEGKELTSQSLKIQLASRPSGDALQNWLWCSGVWEHKKNTDFFKMHGFDFVGGPVLPYSTAENPDRSPEALGKAFRGVQETMNGLLADGLLVAAIPNAGLWYREFTLFPPEGEDVKYANASRNGEEYYNPFNPTVAQKQNEANRHFLEALKDFPNFTIAWTDMEHQDNLLKPNRNKEGREKMAKALGFTEEEVGPPDFVAEKVISDQDRKYRLMKYIFQGGNGVHAALQRMVDMVKKYRPDVLTMTDPYRHAALYDVYPSVDIIHSWTYTNPDPKNMVYIEQLRTACKPRNQIPLQIVTILNYPGMLDVPERRENPPAKDDHARQWMAMGPDLVKEATWINLSRAPQFVGYFYGSEIDPVKYADDTYRIPPATSEAIGEMAKKVFHPYGKMIRKLKISPRKIAVLNSQAAALYNASPNNEMGSYAGYRTIPFQIVLEMAHYNADVLFDESVERGALDHYDVLFLPRVDVLTETVYNKIHEFQKRGGLVYSDQFLGPKLDAVHRFDFNLAYRKKVNARANAMGTAYSEWNDQAEKTSQKVNLEKVQGIPAHKDQEIMEEYAKTLKSIVSEKVPHVVDSDNPTVLFNLCEKDGVKYLFVINDKRTYDERVGKFMGSLEKLVPQTVNVRLSNPENTPLVAYDMLTKTALPVTNKDGTLTFPVKLDALGGTIIALAPEKLDKIAVSAKTSGHLGEPSIVSVNFRDAKGQPAKGLQPVRIDIIDPKGNIHEDSDWICLENGQGTLTFHPAWNDPDGEWKVKVSDLTAGLSAQASVTFKKAH